MKKPLCESKQCQVHVVHPMISAPVAYVSSALALSVPFLNSAGADVRSGVTWTGLDLSFLSLVIVGVWILSGIVGTFEGHSNIFLCVVASLGLPGAFLALLAAGQL